MSLGRYQFRMPLSKAISSLGGGLSMEPLLGKVNLKDWGFSHGEWCRLDWIIVGCEKLPGNKTGRFADGYAMAALNLRDQCAAAGVPFFHKQMPVLKDGTWRVSADPHDWPIEFRVQETPFK